MTTKQITAANVNEKISHKRITYDSGQGLVNQLSRKFQFLVSIILEDIQRYCEKLERHTERFPVDKLIDECLSDSLHEKQKYFARMRLY